jgi:hypothetical protein
MVKELAAENGIAVLDLKLADSPKLEELEGYPSLSEKITKDWSETALDDYHAPYDMRRKEHILQTLEDKGFDIMELKIADQHPPEDFLNMVDVIKEADLSFGKHEHARVDAVKSILVQDGDKDVQEFVHIDTCRTALWIAENDRRVNSEDYTQAHLWLDAMQKLLTGDKNANIHRNGVSEDRHSELLRIGQGDMERSYCVDGCQTGSTGRHGFPGRQSDPIQKSCACNACRGKWEANQPHHGTGCDN